MRGWVDEEDVGLIFPLAGGWGFFVRSDGLLIDRWMDGGMGLEGKVARELFGRRGVIASTTGVKGGGGGCGVSLCWGVVHRVL